MQIASTVADCRRIRLRLPGPVGFVPTMGYLHEGHLSLVRRARAENASVVVSIFVNPIQFGPREDLAAYPRDTGHDLDMLEVEGVHLVFIPDVNEMYPAGFDTRVEVGALTQRLEGACRPGHFSGVATVVAKLFNIVCPERAYFGQKDYQQALVIRRLAADLDTGVDVIVLPTVREADGLAMSSRNVYLNPVERQAATVLYQALKQAESLWRSVEKDAGVLRQAMSNLIRSEPLAEVDYISVADGATLEELDVIRTPALLSLAVRIGRTRLIDNIVLE